MVKWLPPNGFTAKVHHMDVKVGGTFRMSFTNFSTGQSHAFGAYSDPAVGAMLDILRIEPAKTTARLTTP